MSQKLLWAWKIDLYTLIRFLYDSENIDSISVSIATVVLLKRKKHICVHIIHNYSICPVIPKVRRFGFETYEKCEISRITFLELVQFSRFKPSIRPHWRFKLQLLPRRQRFQICTNTLLCIYDHVVQWGRWHVLN